MRIILLVAFLIGLSGTAAGQDNPPKGQRAIDLMWDCQGKGTFYTMALDNKMKDPKFFSAFDMQSCIQYLAGVVDANAVYIAMKRGGIFCFPKIGLTAEQQILIFLKWTKENPERLHKSRRSGLFEAFNSAFPCN
jgi:hypothetical protein